MRRKEVPYRKVAAKEGFGTITKNGRDVTGSFAAKSPKFASMSTLSEVKKRVDREDANLKKFPKSLQVLGKAGRTLGALVSPWDSENLAHRMTRKKKSRMSEGGTLKY